MKISHEDLLGSDFAQNGKEGITVRHLLLHNSGLSAGPSPTFCTLFFFRFNFNIIYLFISTIIFFFFSK